MVNQEEEVVENLEQYLQTIDNFPTTSILKTETAKMFWE